MPISGKAKESDDPDARWTTFVFKPRWFVLSQTEGQAVEPETAPSWSKELALTTLAITETPFAITDGNCQGYASKRSISISPLAALPHKTTFHELGHVVLGHTEQADFSDEATLPRDLREVEAESVALICCESLQLSGAEFCRGYIQNWMSGREVIPEASAQKIFTAADKILKAGSPQKEMAHD